MGVVELVPFLNLSKLYECKLNTTSNVVTSLSLFVNPGSNPGYAVYSIYDSQSSVNPDLRSNLTIKVHANKFKKRYVTGGVLLLSTHTYTLTDSEQLGSLYDHHSFH
jgi:hypothetical protein